jgi:hypothetical protein
MVCNRKLLDGKDLAVQPSACFFAIFPPISSLTGAPMRSSTGSGVPTLAGAIDTARMKAGLSDQDLAYAQGILPSLWSRQLHGQGHIALDRLAHTPLQFRVELIGQLEALWGIETTLETIHHDLVAMRAEMAKLVTKRIA